MVERNQKTVERVARLRRDLTFDQKAHQDRDHHDSQCRRARHSVGFSEGQWAKQSPFLPFKGEDGNERQRNDQQADKQRRPDFYGSISDLFPARGVIHLRIWMCHSCQCSSRLCAFSIITIAASTIAPTAIAIPPSDMILAFGPW